MSLYKDEIAPQAIFRFTENDIGKTYLQTTLRWELFLQTAKKIGLVFMFIGALPLFVGIFWGYKTIKFSQRSVPVMGKVLGEKIDTCESTSESDKKNWKRTYTCYQPVVSYEAAGKPYQLALPERSSGHYNVGEAFELLVDPQVPHEASSASGVWIGPIIVSCIGSMFFGVGFAITVLSMRKASMVKALLQSNSRIRAQVVFCGPNKRIKVNGRHPFIVTAQWRHPSSGSVLEASTLEEIWQDPAQTGQIGEDGFVDVAYDEANPSRCMIILPPYKLKAVS